MKQQPSPFLMSCIIIDFISPRLTGASLADDVEMAKTVLGFKTNFGLRIAIRVHAEQSARLREIGGRGCMG